MSRLLLLAPLALLLSGPAGAFSGAYDIVLTSPVALTDAYGFANVNADGTIEHHFPLGFFVGQEITAYGSWEEVGIGVFETRTRAIYVGGSWSVCELLGVTGSCVVEFRNQESLSGSQIVGVWNVFVGPIGGPVSPVNIPITSAGDRIEVLP